jgi:hypothetical protein
VGAALSGEPEDFFPPFRPQCLQRDHVSIVRQDGAGRQRTQRPRLQLELGLQYSTHGTMRVLKDNWSMAMSCLNVN